MRGFFGVALYQPKTEHNIGGVLRSAFLSKAKLIWIIGPRGYKRQSSDTYNTTKHVPLIQYQDFDTFYAFVPHSCRLIAVEMGEEVPMLSEYKHPERAIYLFGSEDNGLPEKVISRCHGQVRLPGGSWNLASAASIVMYDRISKRGECGI